MEEGIREIPCEFHEPGSLALSWPKCDCLYRIDDHDNAGFCKRPEYYRCVKEAGIMPVPLSYSSVSNFLTCPMMYYLKDIRGIVIRNEATSKAIKMGQLWDKVKQKLLAGKVDIGEIIESYNIENMEIAKVRALNRAYKELEITVDPVYTLQKAFNNEIVADGVYKDSPVKVMVKGFYDRKYQNYFVEDKLSSRPDNYLDVWFIQSQIGAYFLADPSLEYCIMEVTRVPDLKSTGKFKDESAESYEERAYQDIISRPSFYFLGWDKETKRYGKRYYRSEFDLESIRDRFRIISILIHDCAGFNGWYKNDRVCGAILPGIACEMKAICRNGNMSEEVYKVKDKVDFII
jgi:heat shock protein HspQ